MFVGAAIRWLNTSIVTADHYERADMFVIDVKTEKGAAFSLFLGGLGLLVMTGVLCFAQVLQFAYLEWLTTFLGVVVAVVMLWMFFDSKEIEVIEIIWRVCPDV